MNSKMLNSPFYLESKKQNTIVPNFIFEETAPARKRSKIPGFNLHGMMNHGENNWVDMELMPDKKTFMAFTDVPRTLEMDINSLKTKGKV